MVLSADQPELFSQMPEVCSYRLLHENKPLPDWHPLVTGDPTSGRLHEVVVNGKLNSEYTAAQTETKSSEPTEEKTGLMAENARRMIDSTLDAAEATTLTGSFLSTANHQIRTSLNGIVGMAQLIADTQLSYEQRNCIDTVLESTTGLLKTITYVLDISKIESGQMDIHETAQDLREMCDRLFSRFVPLADQKGIRLTCECLPNVPISLMCDGPLVERVLGNLIASALERTGEGSVNLEIQCPKKGSGGAELLFKVIDTAVRMDEELQTILLKGSTEPVMQSFRNLCQGIGIDLAVAKHVTGLMGGELKPVNLYREGNALCVSLTLRQANHPASSFVAEIDKVKTILNPRARILLAEDNKVNQRMVVSILRKAGCEIDAVENGEDAVRKIREGRYDLVLMDCQMPVLDGFEATARIRALDEPACRMSVIALTAHAMKGDRQKCFDSGMNGYLAKPIGRQELIDTVNKYTSEK